MIALLRLVVLLALLSFSSFVCALPMYGVRIVYFNGDGNVIGLEVQPCQPGRNGANPLKAGVASSAYWRRDEMVCSGGTSSYVCNEVMSTDGGGGTWMTTVCDYQIMNVGNGVYTAEIPSLPAGITLNMSYDVYELGGRNYGEIWSEGIEVAKANVLNGGEAYADGVYTGL